MLCPPWQTLHTEFLRECRKQCDPAIRAFVECSKREGLLVVFRCREQNKAMNACLHPLSTDVKYEEWKKKLGIVSTPDGPKRVTDLK